MEMAGKHFARDLKPRSFFADEKGKRIEAEKSPLSRKIQALFPLQSSIVLAHTLRHSLTNLFFAFSVWFTVRLMPGGHFVLFMLIETSILLLSNFYCVVRWNLQRVKSKTLLMLQMVRSIAVLTHAVELLTWNSCQFPRAFVWVVCSHAVLLVLLFRSKCTRCWRFKVRLMESQRHPRDGERFPFTIAYVFHLIAGGEANCSQRRGYRVQSPRHDSHIQQLRNGLQRHHQTKCSRNHPNLQHPCVSSQPICFEVMQKELKEEEKLVHDEIARKKLSRNVICIRRRNKGKFSTSLLALLPADEKPEKSARSHRPWRKLINILHGNVYQSLFGWMKGKVMRKIL